MGTEAACSSRLGLGWMGTLLWMGEVHGLTRTQVMLGFVLVSVALRGMRSRYPKRGFRSGVMWLRGFGQLMSLQSIPRRHAGGFCKTVWSVFRGTLCHVAVLSALVRVGRAATVCC